VEGQVTRQRHLATQLHFGGDVSKAGPLVSENDLAKDLLGALQTCLPDHWQATQRQKYQSKFEYSHVAILTCRNARSHSPTGTALLFAGVVRLAAGDHVIGMAVHCYGDAPSFTIVRLVRWIVPDDVALV
jgi:hypothetical protein